MTPERWGRLKGIFSEALELAPERREAFLESACADDRDLIAELHRLLAEHDRNPTALSRPALAASAEWAPELQPHLSAGTVLARRFRITRYIARGGMGEVYEAEDLELGERVALKTIRPQIAANERILKLFKQEIQLARRVTHPNVCRIYDLEQDTDGGRQTTFLTMELLEGRTLAQHLREHGPFSPQDALPIIAQIAEALEAAHNAGVIHRDLKPGNVMLTAGATADSFRAVVTDFGLALSVLASDTGHAVTEGGTPGYMAPEQLEGGAISGATDIYSLGLVIAEMIGAWRNSQGWSRLQMLLARTPSKVSVPRSLARWEEVLNRCLDPDPSKRYSRPAEVAQALGAGPARSPALTRRRLTILSVGALGALALVFALQPWRFPRNSGNRTTAARQLYVEDPFETAWSPSPDGRFLAFTDYHTGNLMLRELDTGTVRRLTRNEGPIENAEGIASDAIFSPDGYRLAYRWSGSGIRGAEIRVIGSDGQSERTIYRNPSLLFCELWDWTPDGSRILASFQWDDQRYQMAVIPVAAGSVLYPKEPQDQPLGRALFSPDLKSVVYSALQGGDEIGNDIYSVRLNGGTESALIRHPANDLLIGWWPRRPRLIFLSDRTGSMDLWSAAISETSTVGEPEQLLKNAPTTWPLGLTSDGTLYYRLSGRDMDVYTAVLDLKAGKITSRPQKVTPQSIRSSGYPNWSPDGRKLVFDFRGNIGVYSVATGKASVIPARLVLPTRSQWHPSGKWIDVVASDRKGQQGHFRVDPATGEARLLISVQSLESRLEGVWSPDGRTMYNRFTDPRRGIFRLDIQTGSRKILWVPPADADIIQENLALSPDGRMLAFHSRQRAAKRASLMVIPAAGGEARPLLTIHQPEEFRYGAFAWTPDSGGILAVRTQGVTSEIWRVPVLGGPPTRIEFPSMFVAALRLNPDGKTIAFHSRVRSNEEIWILEHFLPEE